MNLDVFFFWFFVFDYAYYIKCVCEYMVWILFEAVEIYIKSDGCGRPKYHLKFVCVESNIVINMKVRSISYFLLDFSAYFARSVVCLLKRLLLSETKIIRLVQANMGMMRKWSKCFGVFELHDRNQ